MYLLHTGQFTAARAAANAAYASLTRAFGADHWRAAWASALEGAALAALGRYPQAEPLLVAAYGVLRRNPRMNASQLGSTLQFLVQLYVDWRRPEEVARYRALRTAAVLH